MKKVLLVGIVCSLLLSGCSSGDPRETGTSSVTIEDVITPEIAVTATPIVTTEIVTTGIETTGVITSDNVTSEVEVETTEAPIVTTEMVATTETTTETSAVSEPEPEELFTVTFDSQGGTEIEIQMVARGCKVVRPEDPTKGCGCVFDGWYVGDEKWSFIGYVVTEDITITARWVDCFGMNAKEREILEGFVEKHGYEWRDIESIERCECTRDDFWGETYDYIRYDVIFGDGKTHSIEVGKEYVEEE